MNQIIELQFRRARPEDLERLVEMLLKDALGTQREDPGRPLNPRYIKAFKAIERDPNNELLVVERAESIVGTLQLTFIPYLSHTGSWRLLIEAVRVDKDFRNQGIGEHMFRWAIERARERGCRVVQLTSDKRRADALRFYRRLGFEATHEGFKLKIAG